MLSAEKNKILTQVGPGTPMGDYLRRYWHPIGGASELDANPIKAIRLFGEDLVLYKDLGGKYGLIDRHCPHRRADLSYGMVEETGIRCNYHGWLMNERGNVIEQPYDDTMNPRGKTRERCLAKAYPVKECAGLLFAYMGPQPVPELPVWEPFTWENGFREVVLSDIPCNWFQCQENSCDPCISNGCTRTGTRASRARAATMPPSTSSSCSRSSTTAMSTSACARARRRAIRSGPSAASRCGRTVSISATTSNGGCRSTTRTRCQVCWFFMRVPKGREPYVQDKVPTWVSPIKDENGRWISSHVINQDIIAWVGQGVIADRTKENLGASDLGIAMMRKRLFDELDAVARGEEPKAIVRSANVASCIELPNITKKTSTEGITLAEYPDYPLLNARLKGFRHCYGQPPEVRRAFAEAMGIAP